jgi:soluble P-type ATPase
MLERDIPGFGAIRLEHLVSDFTGTLSVDGKLLPGVKERLNRISEFLNIPILTSDTFGTAHVEREGVICELHLLTGDNTDVQKEVFINEARSRECRRPR